MRMKSLSKWWLKLWLALFSFVATGAFHGFSSASTQPKVSVSVMEQAIVNSEIVLLGEVAQINSPALLKARLDDLELGRAPLPGKTRTFKGAWIRSRLGAAGLPKDAAVEIPATVTIERASQVVTDEALQQFFTEYLAEHLGGPGADYELSRFKARGNGPVVAGSVRLAPTSQPPRTLSGHVSISVMIEVDGKALQRVDLSAWVDRFDQVLCAAESLAPNTVLTEQNLELQRRNITKVTGEVVRSTVAAVGKRLKQRAAAGAMIFANMMEVQPLVEKGSLVTIVAESSSLYVRAAGVAMSAGGAGDQIVVQNISSKKDILARVLDDTTVRVIY